MENNLKNVCVLYAYIIYMHIYIYLNHFVMYLKITQLLSINILPFFFKSNWGKNDAFMTLLFSSINYCNRKENLGRTSYF